MREIRVGDFMMGSRPAVRPEDEPRNPSEYARRFGLQPIQAIRDIWGHSGLTPTDPAFQTSSQPPEDDAFDESIQTMYFHYTSAELVAQGAYNPRLPISWPPDLDEPVDDLFARYRWSQAGPLPVGYWEGVWDVRYGAVLNGTPGTYNALANQTVWDAIEPALKLVSRIVRSNHPYWLAMTNMFHMRPVPAAKDGRSPAQRAAQGGRPYTSVWLDDDDTDPRIPAAYPEMAILKSLGFDSEVARSVCLDTLRRHLNFHIYHIDAEEAGTFAFEDYNLIIGLDAGLIWPLITTKYVSNSEKVACTFNIANSLLHELAHACAIIHRDMTTRPQLLQRSSFGPRANAEIWGSLKKLGFQIYGVASIVPGTAFWDRPFPRQQLFAEDEVQGEEGLNFEKRLWGGRIAANYAYHATGFAFTPLLIMLPFPKQHPQPLQQGRTQLDQVDRAYERFLTSPRASSWVEILAVPTAWYARYFQNAWWQHDFQKFKHHGLKLSTNDPNLPISVFRTNSSDAVLSGDQDDVAVLFGHDAWEWLVSTVLVTLEKKDLYLLSFYMQALIGRACAATLFRTRFDNEMRAWPAKYAPMIRAARSVSDDYQIMVDVINRHMLPGAAAFDYAGTAGRIREMNDSIRRVLGPMLELSRLMSQEVAYQQFILTQYLHLETGVKAIFLGNMQALRVAMTYGVNLLTGQTPNVPLQFSTLTPETEGGWASTLQQKVVTDFPDGNLPGDIVSEGLVFVNMMSEITSLHRGFQTHLTLLNEMNALIDGANANGRAPETADWPRLQSFTRIRSRRNAGAYQAVALRELASIDNAALGTMMSEALALLATKLEPEVLDPAKMALKSAEDRRALRQAELLRNWRLFLRNQKRLMVNREKAREAQLPGVSNDPTADELFMEMWGMANGNEDDLRMLNDRYSPQIVQDTLYFMDLDFPDIVP